MTRAVQEGTVAVGDAAAGRVRRAFEDAGDGRGAERGGTTMVVQERASWQI